MCDMELTDFRTNKHFNILLNKFTLSQERIASLLRFLCSLRLGLISLLSSLCLLWLWLLLLFILLVLLSIIPIWIHIFSALILACLFSRGITLISILCSLSTPLSSLLEKSTLLITTFLAIFVAIFAWTERPASAREISQPCLCWLQIESLLILS